MPKSKLTRITFFTLLIVSALAKAQNNEEPGMRANGKLSYSTDSNIYRVIDELAKSDQKFRFEPELNIVGALGKHRFYVEYNGDYAKFNDSSEADYLDHNVKIRSGLEHTVRLNSSFELGYIKEHEEPGSINRIQLDMSEYNKYDQNYFLAAINYGTDSAIGKLSFNYKRTDKKYSGQELAFLDNVNDRYLARFTYRLAPNTKVYTEAVLTDFDYATGGNFELDNTFKRYRAGVSWELTGKLSGDINMGYQDRDYDLETLRDINGLAYDGKIDWLINTYTKLQMVAKRESIDSSLDEVGGFLRTSYGINVEHKLTPRLSLNTRAGYALDELVLSSEREDERYEFNMGFAYELTRRINIAAEYLHEQRDSTLLLAEYTANIISISCNIALGE